ncbi:MAG: hypothetical protein JWN14_2503, partial [Chthonomonadales bacterium]|nr:hypothetical protein [Chthonomonadales bacterium]
MPHLLGGRYLIDRARGYLFLGSVIALCKRYNDGDSNRVRYPSISTSSYKEDRNLQDHMIRAVDRPGCEQRTIVFTWCSACKEGFNSKGHRAFEFTCCPLCGAEPMDGFLPWS